MTDHKSGQSENLDDDNLKMSGELAETYWIFCAVPSSCRLIYLLHLLGMESHLIALIQGIGEETVEQHLAEAETALRRQFEYRLETELELENASESTIRQFLHWIPVNTLALFRLFKKLGSIRKAAEELGLTRTEALVRLELLDRLFQHRIESMIRHLLEIDLVGTTSLNELTELVEQAKSCQAYLADPDEQRNSQTRHRRSFIKPARPISDDEISVAGTTIDKMPMLERNTLELHCVGLDHREIAANLEIETKEVREHLRQARSRLHIRLERLVVGLIQRHVLHWAEAPKLDQGESEAAWAVIKTIPRRERYPFARYMATGLSMKEVADMFQLHPEQVDYLVLKVKKRIRTRAMKAASALILQGEDIETLKQRILGHIRHVLFLRDKFPQRIEHGHEQDKPLLKLDDAERHETALVWSELEPDWRDAYVLHRGWNWSSNDAGDFLGISGMAIEERIGECRSFLKERFIRLVVAWLQDNRLTEFEAETARRTYHFLPNACREAFKRSMLTGESDAEIATALNLTADEVSGRIDFAKRQIELRSELLTVSWLREIEKGQSRRIRFLAEIHRRAEAFHRDLDQEASGDEKSHDTFTRAELIEIEKAITAIDLKYRETFILAFGPGLDLKEIATLQKTDEQETARRLREGIDTVNGQMERLIVGWLQQHLKFPNAPRLKTTEEMTAKEMFATIPQKFRDVFVRFRVKGESAKEISAVMPLHKEIVEEWLDKTERMIGDRTVLLASTALMQVRDGRPVGEILLDDLKRIKFPAAVWEASEPGKTPRPAVTPAIKPEPAVETTKKKNRTPFSRLLAGVGMLFTQLGAASPVHAAGMAIPSGLAVLTAPFLWIMSLLTGCQVYGLAFIRIAPTLEARQWLVKQLLWCYAAIFISPLVSLLFFGHVTLPVSEYYRNLMATLFPLGCILSTLFYTVYRYPRHCEQREASSSTRGSPSFVSFGRWINITFLVGLLLLAFLALAIGVEFRTYARETGRWTYGMSMGIIIGCGAMLFHYCSYYLFRYGLKISKDEKAFSDCPPITLLKNRIVLKTRLVEFVRIFPFTLFPIPINLLHLIFVRTQVARSFTELVIYSVWWSLVWYFNVKIPEERWSRILKTFVLQVAIMFLLRRY